MIFASKPSPFVAAIIESLARDEWEIANAKDSGRMRLCRADGQIAVDEHANVYVKQPGAHYDPDRLFELTGSEGRAIRKAARAKIREVVAAIAAERPASLQAERVAA